MSGIPSLATLTTCLPSEYTSNPQLYSLNPPEGASKINLLLTHSAQLFSEHGLTTVDKFGVPARLWARLHFSQEDKPNGIVLCMLKQDFFYAWKGKEIAEPNQTQSFLWDKDTGFEFKNTDPDNPFPPILKSAFLDAPSQKDYPNLKCAISVWTPKELEKIREFCDHSHPYLPDTLDGALSPHYNPRSIQGWALGVMMIAIIAVGVVCFKLMKPPPSLPEKPNTPN